jgi:hypothetical protein
LSHSSGFNHAVSINCSTHHILCFDGCSRDLNIIEGIILGDAVQNSFASLVLHFVLMEQMCIKKIHYLSNVPLPAFKLAGKLCSGYCPQFAPRLPLYWINSSRCVEHSTASAVKSVVPNNTVLPSFYGYLITRLFKFFYISVGENETLFVIDSNAIY